MTGCEPVCRCCGRDMTLELDALREELARYRRFRTLGGPPHPPDPSWANRVVGPPESARVAPWEQS